jgi:hypothetical protein
MWNFGETVINTVNVGSGVQMLDEQTAAFYQASLDEAGKILAKTPVQGSKYFKVRNTSKNNISSKDQYGIGLAEVNSDGEALPIAKSITGFEQTITSYVIRQSMGITREAMDDDRFGVIADDTARLIQSGEKTVERILADMFNRGFGTLTPVSGSYTTALSALAEDGLALFSGERPQPRATAGTWANLNAAGSLTATTVADARTSFNTYLDGNGDLAPQMLNKVIISPELEDTMKEISGTSLKVDTSLNTTNVVAGTPYEVWHWLNANTVIYEGDCENGVEFHVRQSPSTTTWQDGNNPDVIRTRLRMQMGTGIKRPGRFIGQLTS